MRAACERILERFVLPRVPLKLAFELRIRSGKEPTNTAVANGSAFGGEDGGFLKWELTKEIEFKIPPDELVQKFAELYSAPAGKIAEFARKYGVLQISDPLLPPRTEPIAEWHKRAGEVRSMLLLAASLRAEGEMITKESLVGDPPPKCPKNHATEQAQALGMIPTVHGGSPIYVCRYPHCRETKPYESRVAISEQVFNEGDRLASILSPWKPPRKEAQEFPSDRKKAAAVASYWLDLTVDQWISRWPATLAFDREAGILRLRVNYTRGLMSALALQLLQAVARQSVYVCAECLQPFLKAGAGESRGLRRDRDTFCEKHGIDIASKRTDKRRRQKISEAKRLHAEGLRPAEIVKRLKVRATMRRGKLYKPVDTVRRWVKRGK